MAARSKAKLNEQKIEVEQKLSEFSKLTDQEVLDRFGITEEGLNQVEAGERLEEFGRNIIDAGNENSLFKRIREAIINPFNIVLIAVAVVTLFTDVIFSDSPMAEMDNIGFMGSNIVSGSAKAVVLTTGNQTYFGSMAKSLNTYQDKSSYEKNINSISRLLIGFMIVLVPVIFIANFLTKGN